MRLRVGEEGTGDVDAAPAVTHVEPDRALNFVADHPMIYDEQSGMILFMGRIVDPTA